MAEIAEPRDSVSTASDLTIEGWERDRTDPLWSADGDPEAIPLDEFYNEPFPGLRRLTPLSDRQRQSRWIQDPHGLCIVISVMLGMAVFVSLLPWLAGPDRPGSTPPTPTAQQTLTTMTIATLVPIA